MSESETTEKTTEAAESSEPIGEGRVGGTALRNAAGKLEVEVEVLDERNLFGRNDVLVTPVRGSGEAWISVANVDGYEGSADDEEE